MIQQNVMMSRDARKLLTDIEDMARVDNITTLVTLSDIFVAEQMILKYFTAPLINLIKSKLKNIKNRTSKHYSLNYWITIVEQSFTNINSVKRDPSIIIDGALYLDSFSKISTYLITDYSIFDAEVVYQIIHRYDCKLISDSILTAKSCSVYNIQYVKAIIEKSYALSKIKTQEMMKLGEKANMSNAILNKEKVSNTIIDVAQASYNWESAKENSEIEEQFKKLFGGI